MGSVQGRAEAQDLWGREKTGSAEAWECSSLVIGDTFTALDH